MSTRSPLAAALLSALASIATACGSTTEPGPCTAGGDGSYVAGAYSTLAQYCLVSLAEDEVVYSAGVVPFDLNTPLYSDDAVKRRAVYVPPGKTATYSADGAFEFPTGSVLIKTFGFRDDMRKPTPAIRWVETRLLVKADDGWHSYPYIWDAAETSASYSPGGQATDVSFIDETGATKAFSYLVPSATQCRQCHEDSSVMKPIGPKARNLNRTFKYEGGEENQLAHWTQAGILTGAPVDPTTAPKLAVWNDPATGNTEQRARAYLEVNCAHCHSAGGAASTSGLFLWASETDPHRYGVCKEPLSAGPGAGGRNWDVVPGRPDESITAYRMESVAPGVAMPQIGRSTVHGPAVTLVREWITGLPTASCNH